MQFPKFRGQKRSFESSGTNVAKFWENTIVAHDTLLAGSGGDDDRFWIPTAKLDTTKTEIDEWIERVRCWWPEYELNHHREQDEDGSAMELRWGLELVRLCTTVESFDGGFWLNRDCQLRSSKANEFWHHFRPRRRRSWCSQLKPLESSAPRRRKTSMEWWARRLKPDEEDEVGARAIPAAWHSGVARPLALLLHLPVRYRLDAAGTRSRSGDSELGSGLMERWDVTAPEKTRINFEMLTGLIGFDPV